MIEIRKYDDKYANSISNLIIDNLYQINIKDHGKEIIDSISNRFTADEIKKAFPKRTESLVAIDDSEVVGTASIDRFKGDKTGKKFIILTVFTKIDKHNLGVGTKMIKELEKIALNLEAQEIVIPSSIYACDFYRKLGFEYEYLDGEKIQNEKKEYMLIKKY